MYENKFPHKVGKMIAVDIGLNVPISWRLVFYQSLLALVYLSSQLFGDFVGNAVFAGYRIIMTCFPFMGPLCADSDARYVERLHPRTNMTYPYYYLYHNIFTGNMKKALSKFPSCPFLYMVSSCHNHSLLLSIVSLCYSLFLIVWRAKKNHVSRKSLH